MPWFLTGSKELESKELRTNLPSGFYWMVGFAERGIPASHEEFFQKYLSRVDATFASNPYLRGAYIQIPWNGVESAAGKLDFEPRVPNNVHVFRREKVSVPGP